MNYGFTIKKLLQFSLAQGVLALTSLTMATEGTSVPNDSIDNSVFASTQEVVNTQKRYVPKDRCGLEVLLADKNIKLKDIDTSNIKNFSFLFTPSNVLSELRQTFIYNEPFDLLEHDVHNEIVLSLEEIKLLATAQKCAQYTRNDNYDGIENWDVSSAKTMLGMFFEARNFNEPIGKWDISNVTSLKMMFTFAQSFNQPLNSWNTSKVVTMERLFDHAKSFDQPLDKWDTSNVINMANMFSSSKFNQPIGNWDTGNVQDMSWMFGNNNYFNQAIGNWNTAKVSNVSHMFFASAFNQPLDNWNTSNFNDMTGMFAFSFYFNQPLDKWDTSKVISMKKMFFNSEAFNQQLSHFNLSKVKNMDMILAGAKKFNQDLSDWDISNITYRDDMFVGTAYVKPPFEWRFLLVNSYQKLTQWLEKFQLTSYEILFIVLGVLAFCFMSIRQIFINRRKKKIRERILQARASKPAPAPSDDK